MNIKQRIISIRLMQRMKKDYVYASKIGLSIEERAKEQQSKKGENR